MNDESRSGCLMPSSAASPESGRTGTQLGRRAAGTGRGYLGSVFPGSARVEELAARPLSIPWERARRGTTSMHDERDGRHMTASGRDLHACQGELHHGVEHRAGDVDAEVAPVTRILQVDGDDEAAALGGSDADETGSVVAAAPAVFLRGTCLGRHGVAGNDSPRLASLPIYDGNLLKDAH